MSISELGKRLTEAGRLEMRPLCVYGTDVVPCEAVHSSKVNRCLSDAILETARTEGAPPIYLGKSMLAGVCPGGQAWLGYAEFDPMVKYFVSTGSLEFRKGAAEHYKDGPETVEKCLKALGSLTPLGKYTVISGCEYLPFGDPGVKSMICFGNAEQIRNLCGLIHFPSAKPFGPVIAPWGSSCATLITYPSGIAQKAPKKVAFLGPTDPSGNEAFPDSHLSLGVPISIARRMGDDLERSFIAKKPSTAYPRRR